MKYAKLLLIAAGCVVLAAAAALFFVPKEDSVRVLVAANGTAHDKSVEDQFKQSLSANLRVSVDNLDSVSAKKLRSYDAVYLDPSLKQSETIRKALPILTDYVKRGGHLFLENDFAADFPADFLGAGQLVDLPENAQPQFAYPKVRGNLQSMQDVFRLYAGNFLKHSGMTTIPGFAWGKAIVPSTAESVVTLNGVSLMTLNRVGDGSVLLASAFLPNRYFITGYDMLSGMDPAKGFSALVQRTQDQLKRQPSVKYFDWNNEIPLEPYFSFGFSAANARLRTEFAAYVSKEKYGYSVKKVLGPYGRPAMAFQNHFEALPAFAGKDGIQWAELLKTYNQIPSFSIVRSAFDWQKWHESVAVHLNAGTSDKPHFLGQYDNSFYGSGAHLASGGKPLNLAQYPTDPAKSLSSPIELPYRAYPALADLDADGKADLVAGSQDGYLYLYAGKGKDDAAYANQPLPAGLAAPDAFGEGRRLLDAGGQPLRVDGGYAAPAVYDADGDGRADLLVGDGQGGVRAYLNRGGGAFAPAAEVIAGGAPLRVSGGFAAPAVGDADGDGVPDLVVGSGDGRVLLHRGIAGSPAQFGAGREIARVSGRFAAPSLRDMDGDGRADLVAGGSEGDLQVFLQPQGQDAAAAAWTPQGPVSGDSRNMVGSQALVGGHNSVPLWYDINHDGKDDLIVGQLEFGPAVPIDDPNFPYKKELQEFIQYSKDNKLELYPHIYVHQYVSDAQEKREIALQRKSFETLGIPWKETGTNQHTWRINNADRLQTLRNENAQDLWFNFGFKPPNEPHDPRYVDYVWGIPFLLQDPQLKKPMLLHTPTTGLTIGGIGSTEDIFEAFAAQDLPVDYFEHIEYNFPNADRVQRNLKEFAGYFDKFRTEHDYNFVQEPQMAASFLTALTAEVKVNRPWASYLIDSIKDKLGTGAHLTLNMKPLLDNVPEQAGEYRNTLGVVIEPGERFAAGLFASDAEVQTVSGGRLYTGLQRDTQITVDWSKKPFHIIRSNVPIEIKQNGGVRTIALNGDGMQQVKLYSPSAIVVEGDSLKVEENPQEHTWTVTHFGARTSITIRPKK